MFFVWPKQSCTCQAVLIASFASLLASLLASLPVVSFTASFLDLRFLGSPLFGVGLFSVSAFRLLGSSVKASPLSAGSFDGVKGHSCFCCLSSLLLESSALLLPVSVLLLAAMLCSGTVFLLSCFFLGLPWLWASQLLLCHFLHWGLAVCLWLGLLSSPTQLHAGMMLNSFIASISLHVSSERTLAWALIRSSSAADASPSTAAHRVATCSYCEETFINIYIYIS